MPAIPVSSLILALAAGTGLVLAYQVAGTLLLIFAGILLAAVLDAAVMALGKVLPVPRAARLTLVSALTLALVVIALFWGGFSLFGQAREMGDAAIGQARQLAELLSKYGIDLPLPEGERLTLTDVLPSPDLLFGHARNAFGITVGLAANTLVLIFLGLFFAADPAGYRDGFVMLVPPARRKRVREVLTEAGMALRWWLVGQLAMMALVAVSIGAMLALVGIPNAILLGVVTGLLNFIPFLGPILAAVPVFLAAVPEGLSTLLIVVVLFTVIQSVEGSVIGPLVQQRAVHLPPAWSLAALLIAGVLFGAIGVALATPLLAVLRVLLIRLYVEDLLEKGAAQAAAPGSGSEA